MKMRFSIVAKLILIVTIIVLISPGLVTVLLLRPVQQDLQFTAEENNLEINRRAAMETEAAFANIRSNSRLFIRTVTATAGTAAGTETQSTIELFFEENPQIAAVFFTSGSQTDGILVNSRFFHSKEIDEALADSYRDDCVTALGRAAAGETLLLNATPCFTVPVLAMFFPWPGGGAGVLFSQAQLDDVFCFGTNRSYLLNDSGDILIHSDYELVRHGVNVADNDFTRYVWDNQERNSRGLYTDEDGIRYFRAFTKLNTGGCAVITGIEYDKVFEGIAAATRRNIYISVGFLSIAIMFIWFFARGMERNER